MNGILGILAAIGGVTVRASGMRPVYPKRGYAVGATQRTAIMLPLTATETELRLALLSCAADYGTRHAGAWIEGDTIHVDPTIIVASRREALGMAKRNRQKAIYGFRERDTILV